MKSVYLQSPGVICSGLLVILLLAAPALAETVTIAGTGDSQRLLRQLAQDFRQLQPDIQVLVPNSVGSGGGIKLLLAGRSELARVARPLKPKERAENINYRLFAYSPIVFVANLPSSCQTDLSTQQAVAIFSGQIHNWKELGSCPEHKIYVANRENGDSSRTVLETRIPELKEVGEPVGRTIYSTPEAYGVLNRYQFSFGYLPKAQIQDDSLNQLNFNGIAPTPENVQSGDYPLAVPLGIAWRGEPSGATEEFLAYLFSPRAQQLMQQLGAVPAKTK